MEEVQHQGCETYRFFAEALQRIDVDALELHASRVANAPPEAQYKHLLKFVLRVPQQPLRFFNNADSAEHPSPFGEKNLVHPSPFREKYTTDSEGLRKERLLLKIYQQTHQTLYESGRLCSSSLMRSHDAGFLDTLRYGVLCFDEPLEHMNAFCPMPLSYEGRHFDYVEIGF